MYLIKGSVFIFLLLLFHSAFCQRGSITTYGEYTTDARVKKIYDELQQPLLIYRGQIFKVSSDCIPRKKDGANDMRKADGANDARKSDGANDNRKADGANDRRKQDGANDARKADGANDRRKQDGANDTRKADGANDARKQDGANDKRKADGANDARKADGANDRRKADGANDNRKSDWAADQLFCEINNKGELIIHLPDYFKSEDVRMYYGQSFIKKTDNFFTIK